MRGSIRHHPAVIWVGTNGQRRWERLINRLNAKAADFTQFGYRTHEQQALPWSARFDDPIPLPGRKPLATLRDAANYITRLPEAEQATPHWQAAAEALILVAERDGPVMMARIGVMRALNHGVTEPKRRTRAKSYKILR